MATTACPALARLLAPLWVLDALRILDCELAGAVLILVAVAAAPPDPISDQASRLRESLPGGPSVPHPAGTPRGKSRVWAAPGRAHGTASRRTRGQSRQRSRRSSHSITQRVRPRFRWRQRLTLRSWICSGRPVCPQLAQTALRRRKATRRAATLRAPCGKTYSNSEPTQEQAPSAHSAPSIHPQSERRARSPTALASLVPAQASAGSEA